MSFVKSFITDTAIYLSKYLYYFHSRLGAELHEVGLDEGVDLAVHHRVDVRRLATRAVILHTAVVEDVGADLRPPLDAFLARFERLLCA